MVQDAKGPAPSPPGASRDWAPETKPQERPFWIALAGAAVVHTLLIVAFLRSPPMRQMGEKGGRTDGVNVSMIDAAQLDGRSSFAADSAAPGQAPSMQAKAAAPQTAPPLAIKPEPTPPPKAVTEPDLQAKESRQASETVEPADAPKEPKASSLLKSPADAKALQPSPPPPVSGKAKPPEAASKPEPAPKKAAKHADLQPPPRPPLQLALPDTAFATGGGGTGFVRPPGYTRSGENDEFGRGVIRALRKTMPAMNAHGRVTVRLLLSQDGNLIEVRLIRSSGDPLLDQNVMFAVRQTSFPFPPANAPPVDRTFLITYVYQ